MSDIDGKTKEAENLILQKYEDTQIDCPKPKKKFPKIVFLIVFNEFCERFSYSGMRAFLALYLKEKLFYSDDEATEIYHIFSTFAYFFPIFGAILADNYLGKYRTILYLMVVYAIGNTVLAVTAIPIFDIPKRELTIAGLILVSLGTGGIKPCVSAFGGDQFVLPEQEKQLTAFFALFYFMLCCGALVAKTVSPLLRSEVQCFGDKDCYSFGFGAPIVLILSSIVTFMCFKKKYIIKKPTGNVILNVVKCIAEAIKMRFKSKVPTKRSHWLDYATESYEPSFITEIKKVLRIFILFLPLAVFWSLLDQMGSRWTIQASRMDGDFKYFTLKPDQMQVMAPIIILAFIPLFKNVIYPTLAKCNILCKYLDRLTAGCVFAAIAFIFSGLLELKLEKTYPTLPTAETGHLRIFNGHTCNMTLTNNNTKQIIDLGPLGYYENMTIGNFNKSNFKFTRNSVCQHDRMIKSDEILKVTQNTATSYFFKDCGTDKECVPLKYNDNNAKSRSGFPLIRFLINSELPETTVMLYNIGRKNTEIVLNGNFTELTEVFTGNYSLFVDGKKISMEIKLKVGGVYTMLVRASASNATARLITITEPNSISMIWILPQVIVLSIAELLFAVTGLEYAFTEAPESMKSVMQAYWYLVEAFGNTIIIVVTRCGSNYRQATQFFFFSGLMVFAIVIFQFLVKWYENSASKEKDAYKKIPQSAAMADIIS